MRSAQRAPHRPDVHTSAYGKESGHSVFGSIHGAERFVEEVSARPENNRLAQITRFDNGPVEDSIRKAGVGNTNIGLPLC